MGLLDGTPTPDPINPVLHEINSLSPAAQQALMQAHQMTGGPAVHASEQTMGTPSTPAPAPTITPPHMQSQVPQIGASSPHVEAPRGTVQGEENNVARMTNEGSGISQIKNPFLHGLAATGDTIAKIVSPKVEAAIPGTEGHNQQLIAQGNNEVKTLLGQNQTAAQTGLEAANTGRVNEETAEAPQRAEDTHALSEANLGHIGAETTALQNPIAKTEFEAWQKQNPGASVADFEKVQKKPLSAQDAQSRNAVWDTIAPKYHLPTGQFHEGMSESEAAQLASAMNNVVGRNQGGTKITIEQQKADNAGAKSRDATTEKEYMAAQKDLGSQFSGLQTQRETLEQAKTELSGGAVGQAVGTIKTLVGLAGGKGTGVRITTPELNALTNARGIKGSFEGFISGLEGKGKLPPEQVAQMNDLLNAVEAKIAEKQKTYGDTLDKLGNASSTEEIRKIQSDMRHGLTDSTGGGISVKAPNGKTYQFTDQAAADKFKTEAGIK